MALIDISNRRELFWDDFLIEESSGVSFEMAKPIPAGIAMLCDAPWEGNTCTYFTVFQDGDLFRMYYRGSDLSIDEKSGQVSHHNEGVICYAESRDGKHFDKPSLHLVEYENRFDNNIILSGKGLDNFSVFLDTNPACPPDEIYKGLSGKTEESGCALRYYKSADGIRFTFVRELAVEGAFDSLNVAFFDKNRRQYTLYLRDLHGYGNGKRWEGVRDVRVSYSDDFSVWSQPEILNYGQNKPDFQLYTNGISPYVRAPHMFIGLPTRYCERKPLSDSLSADVSNFAQLPDLQRREAITKLWGRSGTAMTDCLLMTSRDGLHFQRTDEAFLTPGPERSFNWYYGDCYASNGVIETAPDRQDAPHELSFFCGENYRATPVALMRYTVRADGFYCIKSDFTGGSFLTKPFIFKGDHLHLNFATSALGSVQIAICDVDRNVLDGYFTHELFGDSIDRVIFFDNPLSILEGKPIRLRFTLCDARIYAMKFGF